MLKSLLILIITIFCFEFHASTVLSKPSEQHPSFSIENATNEHQKINCLILITGKNQNSSLTKIAKTIKFDLNFTDQINSVIKKYKILFTEKQLTQLAKKDISLCLSLAMKNKQKRTIQVEVNDTFLKKNIFKKEYNFTSNNILLNGHFISNDVIPFLTNKKSIALSTLAYCKQLSSSQKVICVTDYTCSTENVLNTGKTINVAPSWHSKAPILFYSQLTKSKGSLLAFNLKTKKQHVVCPYNGLNMQPSFSQDGSKIVLCMSGKSGNSELYLYDQALCERLKKRTFVQLTKNRGNNSSPCLLPNDDIIFCSDFETGNPQLYYLDQKQNTTKRISDGRSYSAAPSYNAQTNTLVYTRYINKVFQLFSYNLTTGKEKQLTFNQGDKLDPSWAHCGNYMAFTYDFKNKKTGRKIPQIAIYNCMSKKIHILTTSQEPKSFPKWVNKPLYQM